MVGREEMLRLFELPDHKIKAHLEIIKGQLYKLKKILDTLSSDKQQLLLNYFKKGEELKKDLIEHSKQLSNLLARCTPPEDVSKVSKVDVVNLYCEFMNNLKQVCVKLAQILVNSVERSKGLAQGGNPGSAYIMHFTGSRSHIQDLV